jgi:hypothetical protein
MRTPAATEDFATGEIGPGRYSLQVLDLPEVDSANSEDRAEEFSITFQRKNG